MLLASQHEGRILAPPHQARAAQSTVAATRAQVANAGAQRAQAQVRLGYTRVLAPVSGTISVRAAREGEVVSAGQPIVTIVDLGDTWVRDQRSLGGLRDVVAARTSAPVIVARRHGQKRVRRPREWIVDVRSEAESVRK